MSTNLPVGETAMRILAELEVDPDQVLSDSLTLTPLGERWLVQWKGVAVLDGDKVAGLFGREGAS